jgi:uncharacterized protein (TIGR03437 family)
VQPRLQIGIRILLLPLAAGLALAQANPALSPHAQAVAQGQPPANLRSIFASPFASRLAVAATSTVSITPGGVVPVYSSNTTIQSGEWISIFGNNLASAFMTWQGNFPQNINGTSVTINGLPGYLEFVSSTQINLQVPDFPAGTSGTVNVVVNAPGGSATSTVTLGQVGPSFLLLSDNVHVAGIILRPDGSGSQLPGTSVSYDFLGPTGSSLGYATKAAKAGDFVEIFGVGFGPTNPTVTSGQPFVGAAAATTSLSVTMNGTTVINGPPFPSGVFAGLSGAGLFQFNLTIPAGLGTGDVPLTAMVGGVQTPSGVVMPLQ